LRAANAWLRNLLAGRDAEIVALRARVAQAEGLVVDLREQVAPQPQPLTASSTARTTTIDPVRAGGRPQETCWQSRVTTAGTASGSGFLVRLPVPGEA